MYIRNKLYAVLQQQTVFKQLCSRKTFESCVESWCNSNEVLHTAFSLHMSVFEAQYK